MGSVKDLKIIKQENNSDGCIGDFIFSDRYSIFDWGEMPDNIKDKGKALALMSAYNFELLSENGIKNHYIGLVNSEGKSVNFEVIIKDDDIPNKMRVNVCNIIKPKIYDGKYDYSYFDVNRGVLNDYLIRLEVIFRNSLPEGSSLLKKLRKANENAREIELKRLGLKKMPEAFDRLPSPIIGFSTKLEPKDRNISQDEAYFISGLSKIDFTKLIDITKKVNDLITKKADISGFEHYDGKIEFLYDGELNVCDVVGTFDENRFGFNGINVSKEVLRKWYRKNQPEFYNSCKEYGSTGEGWQERCPIKPKRLSKEFKDLVSEMYLAGCNKYIGRDVFYVRRLDSVMSDIKKHIGE